MAKKAGLIQKMNDFIKTPAGKIVLIAAVVGVLLFFCLFIFLMFNVFQIISKPEKIEKDIEVAGKQLEKPEEITKQEKAAEEEAKETEKEEKPVEIETFEVFEYRNPFKPTVQIEKEIETEASITTATATGTSTATGITQTTGGSVPLSLEDIYTENGQQYANVVYGGKSYQVTSGDRIADSPYQVQSIGTDSITLLYGDDRIVIRLGETILK